MLFCDDMQQQPIIIYRSYFSAWLKLSKEALQLDSMYIYLAVVCNLSSIEICGDRIRMSELKKF